MPRERGRIAKKTNVSLIISLVILKSQISNIAITRKNKGLKSKTTIEQKIE